MKCGSTNDVLLCASGSRLTSICYPTEADIFKLVTNTKFGPTVTMFLGYISNISTDKSQVLLATYQILDVIDSINTPTIFDRYIRNMSITNRGYRPNSPLTRWKIVKSAEVSKK